MAELRSPSILAATALAAALALASSTLSAQSPAGPGASQRKPAEAEKQLA